MVLSSHPEAVQPPASSTAYRQSWQPLRVEQRAARCILRQSYSHQGEGQCDRDCVLLEKFRCIYIGALSNSDYRQKNPKALCFLKTNLVRMVYM